MNVSALAGPVAGGFISIGDVVTVTGVVSKEGASEASATNVILPKGIENVIRN